MNRAAVIQLAHDLLIPKWQQERARLDVIDRWWRWNPEQIELPDKATKEHKGLRDLGETPWLTLVVTTTAEQLVAELVRTSRAGDGLVDRIWGPWQRNRMPGRQASIYRSALAYGYSYATVMPGDTGAVIQGRSPRDMFAVYQDPASDIYPMYYLVVTPDHYLVVDEEAVFTLSRISQGSDALEYVTHDIHGVGVAPAVRWSNQMDLEGRQPGEVEPYIKLAKRINKTTYDRLLAQHYNSWKVKTATGLEDPVGENVTEEREKQKLKLAQDDILAGGPGVEFGTLDETSGDFFIAAKKSDVEDLAAISQTPAHALTGQLANLGADAIEEARALQDLKVGERQRSYGVSNCDLLRLAAHVEHRTDDAADFTLAIAWADLGSRSLAQSADALGKLSTMLGIPAELLWDRIPSVTAEEASAWLEYRAKHPDATEQLAAAINRGSNGTDG